MDDQTLGYAGQRKKAVTADGWIARAWGLGSAILFLGVIGIVVYGKTLPRGAGLGSMVETGFAALVVVSVAALPGGWLLSILLSRRLTDGELIWMFTTSSLCGLLDLWLATQAGAW